MPKKLRAGILAATGTVGQRFIELLANHPNFEITALAASSVVAATRSAFQNAVFPGRCPMSGEAIELSPLLQNH